MTYTDRVKFERAKIMLRVAKTICSGAQLDAFQSMNRMNCISHDYIFGYSIQMKKYLRRKAIACYNTNCRGIEEAQTSIIVYGNGKSYIMYG